MTTRSLPGPRAFAALTKFPISAVSTLSAVVGYVAFAHAASLRLIAVCSAVLLLAMGGSALNEWQERDIDRKMARTRRRPIPSGEMSAGLALAIAIALLCGGDLLLLASGGAVPAALGLAAAAWYNGLYTPLKRWTAFAVVPGAVIGALPPAIGWASAGGLPVDPACLSLCFFFLIWQVPHFWLLLFRHGRDYESAGLPSLTSVFSLGQLSRLTFIWMLATAAAPLLFPVFGLVASPLAAAGLAAGGVWLGWQAVKVLRSRGEGAGFTAAFRGINLHALLVMLAVILDAGL